MTACGLDFGTSNSAIGVVRDGAIALVPLEAAATLVPTAVFFDFEAGDKPVFGRTAIESYIEGTEGRLMRALKSILGSSLIDEATQLQRRRITFIDVIAVFVRHLKAKAETFLGRPIDHAVFGRPVHFVDNDAEADRRAEASLAAVARQAGFRTVDFVFEPIAAAYHYETTATREELVLVADIGGGTSDFSVIRVGPDRRGREDRGRDILANAGVHIGGTDFDRALSLDQVMPLLGMGGFLIEKNLPMPRGLYSELATWATINFLYKPAATREVETLHKMSAQPEKTARLLATAKHHLGHRIALAVEQAKIDLSDAESAALALDFIEAGLAARPTKPGFAATIGAMTGRLEATAAECIAAAGLGAEAISTIFFTGGSSRVPAVREAIARAAPEARHAGGEDLVSIALGLTSEAQRRAG